MDRKIITPERAEAIRCHRVVADSKVFFQFSEITLGILPGMGGVVIPYRKWPAAAETFHAMIGQAERLSVQKAKDIGMIKQISNGYAEMIEAALAEVDRLKGNIPWISDDPVAESGPVVLFKSTHDTACVWIFSSLVIYFT